MMCGSCREAEIVTRFLPRPRTSRTPRLSSDDRWIAYSSDESGSNEVHVRPFPNVNDGKWVVSTSGGVAPVWSPDGRELFYMNGTTMMSVAVDSRGGAFRFAAPTALFSGPFETGSPNFDVSPDGQYFLMVEADPDAKPTQINVILNWSRELNIGCSSPNVTRMRPARWRRYHSTFAITYSSTTPRRSRSS